MPHIRCTSGTVSGIQGKELIIIIVQVRSECEYAQFICSDSHNIRKRERKLLLGKHLNAKTIKQETKLLYIHFTQIVWRSSGPDRRLLLLLSLFLCLAGNNRGSGNGYTTLGCQRHGCEIMGRNLLNKAQPTPRTNDNDVDKTGDAFLPQLSYPKRARWTETGSEYHHYWW